MDTEKHGFRFEFTYDGRKRIVVELDKDADIAQFFEACRSFAVAVGYNPGNVAQYFDPME